MDDPEELTPEGAWDAMPADVQRRLFFLAVDVLGVYANPDSWFAVSIMSDPPCGVMGKDFRLVDGVRRPGGRARLALHWIAKRLYKAKPDGWHPGAGLQCGACSRDQHADCSGWCFCPQGPCDRPKETT